MELVDRYKTHKAMQIPGYEETRVQKISIDAGFTCPNRDGSKGFGGCTYCNNASFTPFYVTNRKSITEQIEEGIVFFSKKYPTQKYLAYFQAYSNTYKPVDELKGLYEEALSHSDIVGLDISTRPDCVNEETLNYIKELSEQTYVCLEYGIETIDDEVADFINRGHSFEEAKKAIIMTADREINMGVHFVMGLPHQTMESMLNTAVVISELPIKKVKLHQLQIIEKTIMAHQYSVEPEIFTLFSIDEYIDFCIKFLELLRPDIIVERFTSESPADLLIAPKWGIKNFAFVDRLRKRMQELDTWQGKYYSSK